jgi:hypothetical protein
MNPSLRDSMLIMFRDKVMIGSGALVIIPLVLVFACPESPRFFMKRGLYIEAYRSLLRLRGSPIAAAKEMIYLDAQLEAAEAALIRSRRQNRRDAESGNAAALNSGTTVTGGTTVPATAPAANNVPAPTQFDPDLDELDDDLEEERQDHEIYDEKSRSDGPRGFKPRLRQWFSRTWKGGNPAPGYSDPFLEGFRSTNYATRIIDLLWVPRCRRASFAAAIVMIAQQLCGINILAFYSSILFKGTSKPATRGQEDAINNYPTNLAPFWYSWGFGLCNFLFSFPAYWLVDTKVRAPQLR